MAAAAFQLGIKEPITQPTKDDVKEMILRRFNGLSLEEVNEALKLDRFGEFGDPVASYQLFNAEFVGKVLARYKKWLQLTRFNNNLPMNNRPPEDAQELSEDEKALLIVSGAFNCFEYYQETGKIDPGRVYVYEFLYGRNLLPEHNEKFRDRIKAKAQEEAIAETEIKRLAAKGNRNERAVLKNKINELKAGKYSLKTQCKKVILKEYFDGLIAENKTINDVLR